MTYSEYATGPVNGEWNLKLVNATLVKITPLPTII